MPVLGFVACPQHCQPSLTFLPVLSFGACCRLYYISWSPGQVVKPTTGAKAEDRRESQGWLTKLWTWTLPHVISFTACPRLCCLVLTLSPVLGFHACSRLCSLSTALSPVLNFLACPRLWRLLPALLHVLVFATWYQLLKQLLYPTPPFIPHFGHHPPWLGYSAR